MLNTTRQRWLSVLARADASTLRVASKGLLPAYTLIRGPEVGLIMLRGRAGGAGQAFNLGEASVVRCTVKSDVGVVGHGYCLGRELDQAEMVAAIDAGLQDLARQAALIDAVIAPLEAIQTEQRAIISRRAAATKVQFFALSTMRA